MAQTTTTFKLLHYLLITNDLCFKGKPDNIKYHLVHSKLPSVSYLKSRNGKILSMSY